MTKKEFSVIAQALRTYYPKDNIMPNMQAMELWYRELQDITYEVAELAIRKWVATNKWSPSISEIREYSMSVSSGDAKDWGAAWEEALTAVRRYGSYRPQEAYDSMSDLTRECVKRVGFMELCNSNNLSADRANFRMIYEQLAERKRKTDQVPLLVTQTISNLQIAAADKMLAIEEQ